MQKICKRAPNSPLCNNDKMYNVLASIAASYNVPIYLMLGIMSKESGFGTLWAKQNTDDCKSRTYNWHGSKANHTENGVKRTTTVGYGCWIQKYDSIEEGFTSLARTIGIGYKGCLGLNNPALCMSYKYVGNANIAEESRYNHVNSFR